MPLTSKTSKKFSDLKRHFKVVIRGKEHGHYVSSTPSSAARKAVTKLLASNKSKKVEFCIREITQGSDKKVYGPYSGYIEKLKEPIKLKGRVIKYKPVAKLSGKTGTKKRGMRGGGSEIIVNESIFSSENSRLELFITLNSKDYKIYVKGKDFRGYSTKVKYSKYYFYNKTKKCYMHSLADYFDGFENFEDIGGIKECLKNKDIIVIRMNINGSFEDLIGKKLSDENSELNSETIIPPEILAKINFNPVYCLSNSPNNSQANSAVQNNISGFIYEQIDTLEELEKLLEFVQKFNFKDVNTNKPTRKSFRTDDVYRNLEFVIKVRILLLDDTKFKNIENSRKKILIGVHGEYIPFIIKDASGKIISVGTTHQHPLTINEKKYLELHLILAVPGSNKGTGKKSMKLLFDNLPQEYSGIALKPLDGVEGFYTSLGYKPYRSGYYYKTKPSEE